MNRPDDRGGKPQQQQQQPQQPPRDASRSGQQSQQGDGGKQYGEGNYQATRDYNRGVKEHLQTHDVEREARDAAPRSDEEAREMREAEDLGKRKAEGMRDPNDRMPGGDSRKK